MKICVCESSTSDLRVSLFRATISRVVHNGDVINEIISLCIGVVHAIEDNSGEITSLNAVTTLSERHLLY